MHCSCCSRGGGMATQLNACCLQCNAVSPREEAQSDATAKGVPVAQSSTQKARENRLFGIARGREAMLDVSAPQELAPVQLRLATLRFSTVLKNWGKKFGVVLQSFFYLAVAVTVLFVVEEEVLPFLDDGMDSEWLSLNWPPHLLGFKEAAPPKIIGSETGSERRVLWSAEGGNIGPEEVNEGSAETGQASRLRLLEGGDVAAERRILSGVSGKYEEAATLVEGAVHPDRITQAVRLGEEFLYPWPEIYREWLSMRKAFNQLEELSGWMGKKLSSSNRMSVTVDALLPVRTPRFYDHNNRPSVTEPGIRYTWIGHATGLLSIDGLNILFDPVFEHDLTSLNSVLRWFVEGVKKVFFADVGERVRRAAVPIRKLPDNIHLVLLSHNHPDHIMERDIKMICKDNWKKFKNTFWYVPEGNKRLIGKNARVHVTRRYSACNPASRVKEMAWGEQRSISCKTVKSKSGDGSEVFRCRDGFFHGAESVFKITMVPSIHWAGRKITQEDFNKTLWGGYVVSSPNHKAYYSGDTAHWHPDFDEFKKIGRLHGPFDLSVLPIGAYEPHRFLKYQHVDPWEAVKVFDQTLSQVAVGCHWGTFRLTEEGILTPQNHLLAALLDVPKEKVQPLAKTDAIMDTAAMEVPSWDQMTKDSGIPTDWPPHMRNEYARRRFAQARVLRNQDLLGENWLELLKNRGLLFQTLEIGASIEVIRNDDRIKLTRESCLSASDCKSETYDLEARFAVKQNIDLSETEDEADVYD